jgi:GDP-L-fucose synthase
LTANASDYRTRHPLVNLFKAYDEILISNMSRRILVTGGTGLVGKGIASVAHHFLDYDLIYTSTKDADLRNLDEVRNLLRKHGSPQPLDGIIHLAANVGGLYKNMQFPVEMLEDNLMININILKAAHEENIQNVLCFLSTCIFPDKPPEYPITSDMLHEGPPHHSNEGYAHAKRMQEIQCRAYQKQFGRRYFCVVPTNIYGRHDNFHLQDAHVLPALIHKCYLAKRYDIPFTISGDGSAIRQFIYSDDVAKLVLWAYAGYQDIARPLVLAPPPPDAEVSIKNVVSYIADAFDFHGEIIYDTSKPNGQHKKTADTYQVASLPHGIAFTPLREGIQHVVDWFVESYASAAVRK